MMKETVVELVQKLIDYGWDYESIANVLGLNYLTIKCWHNKTYVPNTENYKSLNNFIKLMDDIIKTNNIKKLNSLQYNYNISLVIIGSIQKYMKKNIKTKSKTKSKETKRDKPPKIKIETEAEIADLLYKMIDACPSKRIIKLLLMICMQESAPYALSMLGLLAGKKDVERWEAALALTYVINNWEEAVKKGGKILKEKMDEASKQENKK